MTKLKDAFSNIEEDKTEKTIIKTSKKIVSSRIGKKFIGGYVDSEVSKQLKLLAVEESTTNDKLIKEALNDLFEKYGKSRIA